MLLGAKLKRIRENKHISQQEIADLLGISQKTYSNIESDKSTPSIEQLSKLGELLDFNSLDLLRENGITFNQSNNEFNENSSGVIMNNYPDNLITQYEARIKDLQEIIELLKEQNTYLKEQ